MVQSRLSDRFKRFENPNQNIPQLKFEELRQETSDQEKSGFIDIKEPTSYNVELIEVEFKKALLSKIEAIPVWFEYSEDKQKELITNFVNNKLSVEDKCLSDSERDELVSKLFKSILGFGPIDYLIVQDNVSNIFINGVDSIFIEIAGKILDTETRLNEKQLDFVLKSIYNLSEVKPAVDSPIWNCKVKNLLISAILPPVSENGASISIKKVSASNMDLNRLIAESFFSRDIYEFLISAINQKKNIIISGEMNSGKTLLLDTLIYTSLMKKRGVLIEEFPQLLSCDNSMMKFSLNSLKSEYDFKVLLSTVLRMSPEYLVMDFNNIAYLNSCISTFSDLSNVILTTRSNSIDGAISKFVSSYMGDEKLNEKLAKSKFLSTFDYIVQINKTPDGTRRVTSIVELTPSKTAAQSFKEIVRWENNQYLSEIPQS